MYAGEKLEEGPVKEIFKDAHHPYTWGLLKSLPRLDMDANNALYSIPGTPPNLLNPPVGDSFAARSDFSMKIDYEKKPPLVDLGNGHFVRSWIYVDGAPDMKFNADGTITRKFPDGRVETLETEKSKKGIRFANIREDK